MRAFMMKATRPKLKEKHEHVEPTEDLEEFVQGMKDVAAWRTRYERVLRSSAALSLRAADFAGAVEDLANILDESYGSSMKKEAPEVAALYEKFGRMQGEIAQLLKHYSTYVEQAVTLPTGALLNELAEVEERRRRYDESRDSYDSHRVRVIKAKRSAANQNGEYDEQDPELVAAKDAYDDQAMVLGCQLGALQHRRPRLLFTQAAAYHSAQMKLFSVGLQAAKSLENDVMDITHRKPFDRHHGVEDWCPGEVDEDHTIHSFSENDEAATDCNMRPLGMPPTNVEVHDLPAEMPEEWDSLLSSLDSRLAEMGKSTLNKNDKVFAVNAVMVAATEINCGSSSSSKTSSGRGSLSWGASAYAQHGLTVAPPLSLLSKSAPLCSSPDAVAAADTVSGATSTEKGSSSAAPDGAGLQKASPLPSPMAVSRQLLAAVPSSTTTSSSLPPSRSRTPTISPKRGTMTSGNSASMSSSSNIATASTSLPLPPSFMPLVAVSGPLLGGLGSCSKTPPPTTTASVPQPLPGPDEVLMDRLSGPQARGGVATVAGRARHDQATSGPLALARASTRRAWQSGPLVSGGGKVPSLHGVGSVSIGASAKRSFPLPTEEQVCSESPLRPRPHRSPPLSPPRPTTASHPLPPPPLDTLPLASSMRAVPLPTERPSALPSAASSAAAASSVSAVAHSAPLVGHPSFSTTQGHGHSSSTSHHGSESSTPRSASPLPPPPPPSSSSAVAAAAAVAAMGRGAVVPSSGLPNSKTKDHLRVAGRPSGVEDKEESQLHIAAGSSTSTLRMHQSQGAHRPRRSLSFGGASGDECFNVPGEPLSENYASSSGSSNITRRHSGPLPPPPSPPRTTAAAGAASLPTGGAAPQTRADRWDSQAGHSGNTRDKIRFSEQAGSAADFRWQWLEDPSPGGLKGFPEWSTLEPEQKDSFLQILAQAVISRRETFDQQREKVNGRREGMVTGDGYRSSRSMPFSSGFKGQGAVAGY